MAERRRLKVMVVIGTRPEIIKLSEVIKRLDRETDLVLVHTGQNFDHELSAIFFEDLGLRMPDHFLEAAGSTASETIGKVIAAVDALIRDLRPDAFLVLGDTNSGMAALAARKNRVPFFHMEAGNRCFDLNVPEELNRRLLDHMADFNLVYTEHARRHLIAEGLPQRHIYLTGSPMGEVLAANRARFEASDVVSRLGLEPRKFLVASFHREENVDRPAHLAAIIAALGQLAETYDAPVIISTHPRTRKRLDQVGMQGLSERLRFMKPLGFSDYVRLQMEALCVVSDSGTVSEESALLGFPAITVRNAIERPEALDTGSIIISGLETSTILDCVATAIADARAGEAPPCPVDYQVPNTAQRVVRLIKGTARLSDRWHGLDALD